MSLNKKENDSFIVFDNSKPGMLFDDSSHEKYPTRYYNVINGEGLQTTQSASYYGYVYEGNLIIEKPGHPSNVVSEGMYFSYNGQHSYCSIGRAKAIVIEVLELQGLYPKNNFKAMNMIGGPIEKKGRLKYIDGCSDSLLIPPVKLGDPCFNHLHFPPNINQTQHTHPSHRIGIVADGDGECITPFGNLPLYKNMIFIIKEWDGVSISTGLDGKQYPIGQHAFQTFYKAMNVIAFHPDSDFGPTDEIHPMINRTIVDGVSASLLDDIRTKYIH